MPTYDWFGWDNGDDLPIPEPNKQWLTITEDGEEYAIIVLRTDASTLIGNADAVFAAEADREARAAKIVAALNSYNK